MTNRRSIALSIILLFLLIGCRDEIKNFDMQKYKEAKVLYSDDKQRQEKPFSEGKINLKDSGIPAILEFGRTISIKFDDEKEPRTIHPGADYYSTSEIRLSSDRRFLYSQIVGFSPGLSQKWPYQKIIIVFDIAKRNRLGWTKAE
jgi:hypothetical protein